MVPSGLIIIWTSMVLATSGISREHFDLLDLLETGPGCDNGFRCNNGHCISKLFVCDKENDCSDGSDENIENCKVTCTLDEHLCKPSNRCLPQNFICDGEVDCPDHSDEKNCTRSCRSDEFTCVDSGRCIQSRFVCDGDKDCFDGSDEKNCKKEQCDPEKSFECKSSGYCISKHWRCDGENDCSDGSDEEGCQKNTTSLICSNHEFACNDRITCIPTRWTCDGENDCNDGEDESPEQCAEVKCRSDQFKCKNNLCLPGAKVCNGLKDCRNGEDEENCEIRKETVCDVKTQFNCGGGQCIDLSAVCNGKKDCPDGEDEQGDKCFVNECATANGGCMHKCVDEEIGFKCECHQGYALSSDGKTCSDINECEDAATCSHICINRIGGFKCECIEGYILDPNNHTHCKATEGRASLLLARRHDIRKISLDRFEMTSIVNETKSAVGLDFVFRTGMMFWSDVSTKTIYKAPIDEGSAKVSVVKASTVTSDGLAVDWIYNHIYFTDSKESTIEMTNFDGTMGTVLLKDEIEVPRSIALDPNNGWMYWSDWGASPRIERAGMDGSHRTAIITYDVKWPNGITLDLVRNRIYWVDGKLNTISSANFDGSNRKLILHSTEYLRHPFSITTFEDYIYWSDWDKQTVFKANKFNGENVEAITAMHMMQHPMVVHVYHPYRQPDGTNYCETVNGHCSHLCLPAPKFNSQSPRISCACPTGLILMKNGLTCSQPTTEDHTKNPENKEETPQVVPEKSQSHFDVTITLCVIGFILVLGSLIYLVHRYCHKQLLHTINFDNPVYHKTTEDNASIEKGQTQKMIPNTVHEELEISQQRLFAQY